MNLKQQTNKTEEQEDSCYELSQDDDRPALMVVVLMLLAELCWQQIEKN